MHIAVAFIAVTLTSVTVLVKPLQKCSRHAAVSEVEPPPESRSGQKKKSVGTSKKLWVEQNFKESTMGVVLKLC